MADRDRERMAERETSALSKLQAAAGIMVKTQAERLDWMYEQSATRPTDEELMNKPIAPQKDKDMDDVKQLQDSTAGSLFLRSATKTTEDTLRKLREDPLFQIRRQEQAARENLLANPLVMARLRQKQEKHEKKAAKKEKKAAKKAKQTAKKAAKKLKQNKTKSSSSSSGSSSSEEGGKSSPAPKRPASLSPPRRHGREGDGRYRASDRSRERGDDRRSDRGDNRRGCDRHDGREVASGTSGATEIRSLGPSSHMLSKREEYSATVAKRKEEALASRGAPQRMTEAEKKRRLEQMQEDARRHEDRKTHRIAAAEIRDKEQLQKETDMRSTSDQKYLREMRVSAYTDSNATVADRLKSQRHRRQKDINDPLERDN